MGYRAFEEAHLLTAKNYKLMREAGFNLAFPVTDKTEIVTKAIAAADSAGMKIVVTDVAIRRENTEAATIREYMHNPATAMYYLIDEPGASAFPGIGARMRLAEKTDSLHMPYANLFPNYASLKQLEALSYKAYVEEYVREANPPFISFDNYPFVEKEGVTSMRPDYYKNLEDVRDVAVEAGIPFWSYANGAGHLIYPVPTQAQLAIQVFSGLAYGAQGIQYYAYCSDGNSSLGFKGSAVNPKGKRSATYKYMKNINLEIQRLRDIFLGNRVHNVWHTGSYGNRGVRQLRDSDLPFPFVSVKAGEAGVVVSHFTNNGKNYLMILSKDFERNQNVDIRTLRNVKQIDSRGRTKDFNSKRMKLKPGAHLLFTW